MSEIKSCVCPKCSSYGESVAAINYNQTKVWDKDGTFSGVGVGLTTSGPGIGFGMGSYSEEGVSQTKIAKTFEEPKRSNNLNAIIVMLGVIFVAILMAPTALEAVSGANLVASASHSSPKSFQNFLSSDIKTVIFSILPIAFLVLVIHVVFKTMKSDDKYNAKVYPKKVERFNELRYCKNCNIIFDPEGNYENASEDGYSKMLRG